MTYEWSGQGKASDGRDWTFDLFLDIATGSGEISGRFDWYIDGDLRGTEYVTGSVNRAGAYAMQGQQKTSGRIVLSSYKGSMDRNRTRINGLWVCDGSPGKFWSN